MMVAVPPAGSMQFALPALPPETSPRLRAAVERYVAVQFGDGSEAGGDEWDQSARAITAEPPTSLTDVAVKLLYALHYLHPSGGRTQPSIDLSAFDDDAGHMLLACVADLARFAEGGR